MRILLITSIVFLILNFPMSSGLCQLNSHRTICWDQVSDPNVSSICVYRSTTADIGDYTLVGTVVSSVNEYTDLSSLEDGIIYYYRLRSKNNSGLYSPFTPEISRLQISENSPEEIQQLCRIDNIISMDSTSCAINWSTLSVSTGKLEYWKQGSSDFNMTLLDNKLGRNHTVIINNLEPHEIYCVRVISYSEDDRNLIISYIYDFVFGTTDNGDIEFVLKDKDIVIPEGEIISTGIKLSSNPGSEVEVEVAKIIGDSDVKIESGEFLEFTSSNWDTFQVISISAMEDDDSNNGQAIVQARVTSGVSVNSLNFVVKEDDNDRTDNENLYQNTLAQVEIYPQPFYPSENELIIDFLPNVGSVDIYNLKGLKVYESSWSGTNTIEWDGRNTSGSLISSGRYFMVIKDLKSGKKTRRAILVILK